MSALAPIVWLTGLWVVLWRSTTPATLLSGVVLAAAVVAVGKRRRPLTDDETGHRIRPLALARLVVHVLVMLVRSNLTLAREILTPTDYTVPGIVTVRVPPCSDLVLTVTANCISLTPGTLTLDVHHDPDQLVVHVLHLSDIEAARREIATLHRFAAAALPPRRQPDAGTDAGTDSEGARP